MGELEPVGDGERGLVSGERGDVHRRAGRVGERVWCEVAGDHRSAGRGGERVRCEDAGERVRCEDGDLGGALPAEWGLERSVRLARPDRTDLREAIGDLELPGRLLGRENGEGIAAFR